MCRPCARVFVAVPGPGGKGGDGEGEPALGAAYPLSWSHGFSKGIYQKGLEGLPMVSTWEPLSCTEAPGGGRLKVWSLGCRGMVGW